MSPRSSAPGRGPTVYDVAAAAGVSIATVSRVLRRPGDVRPETSERVMAAVRELGYVPSASARGLAGRSTGVLGLLLPSFDAPDDVEDPPPAPDAEAVRVADDRRADGGADRAGEPSPERSSSASLFFDEVVRGAEAEAWRRGFALMLAAGRSTGTEAAADDIAGRVDGLVVVASALPPELLSRLSTRLPTVVVADSAAADGLDRVLVANTDGMAALVSRLLADHPVRRVAYLAGPADSADEHDRRAGFDRAVTDCGRELQVELHDGDFTERRGREIARRMLARARDHGDLPEAVVCANDQTALGVLDVFAGHGVDVPGRVLVTGFDGVDAGRFSRPRLTTVRQPMIRLGRLAVTALAERMADPSAPPRTSTLPVEVLLRESCPPA